MYNIFDQNIKYQSLIIIIIAGLLNCKFKSMKFFILFLMFIISIPEVSGQKVDIDNYWLQISCVDLPLNYVPANERTFSLSVGGDANFTGRDEADLINIYGWTKVDDDAALDINVQIKGFRSGQASSSNRTVETKDKNGKVTARNTYYKVSVTNSGSGNVRIYGPKNEYGKSETRKEIGKSVKRKEKRNVEVESNPFLKNVDTKNIGDELDDLASTKAMAYRYSLDHSYTYETSETTSASLAFREYNANSGNQIYDQENSYRNDYPKWVSTYLNNQYGYKPYKYYVKFKRLDSDKHPEFSMFDNATKAFKAIFSKMRYNKSEKEVERDLGPIIDYFEGLTVNYTGDDKNEKRLRAAAYYNLARIYQYLDKHDKVIEIGNAIIDSGYDEDDGEDFIKESEELKRKLTFHIMRSRHIVPLNAFQEMDEEGEEEDITGK